jgi:pimeloyl-ACP methyl ester carboxylesterase
MRDTTSSPASAAETRTFPGARRPDRARGVISHGVRLAVVEWGDAAAPPVLLTHGGFDFAGTWDGFAPLLADAGWRVVAWDQRGHGDSEHAVLYSWAADARDLLAVLDTLGSRPIALVGHSKGGGLATDVAAALPERVRCLVNIDGLPSVSEHRDVAEHERGDWLESRMPEWLDHRRRAASLVRQPGTLVELARRRGRMNPRLSRAWLEYLVTIGARRDPDGWRWKIDPTMRFGGFGPWRPGWGLEQFSRLRVPVLGMLGLVPEEMGWGTRPEQIAPYLPREAELVPFPDSGHFIHVEKPREVADRVLRFLRKCGS